MGYFSHQTHRLFSSRPMCLPPVCAHYHRILQGHLRRRPRSSTEPLLLILVPRGPLIVLRYLFCFLCSWFWFLEGRSSSYATCFAFSFLFSVAYYTIAPRSCFICRFAFFRRLYGYAAFVPYLPVRFFYAA